MSNKNQMLAVGAHPAPAEACPWPREQRHNLPARQTSFVGRAREIEDVVALLRTHRFVTLTSAGGMGKTRLSLQIAEKMFVDYPDGIWFVELAGLVDGDQVAQAVALALGVKEAAGRPVQEALAQNVAARALLIVLDNCEHLLAPSAQIARFLLEAGPHVSILASSREPLRASGEKVYPLASLPVPSAETAIALESLVPYDAVRLFADRARAADPTFQLTERNAAAVIGICRRLDGLPLALELAAARVGPLTVEHINWLLADCFRVLTDGSRNALPRQQTLRASIDWSYDLLDTSERMFFRRLSVFAGGFTLEAAQSVCAGGDVQAEDVLDLLTELVAKSLVELDRWTQRYRLLETVRQYGRELLDTSGEVTEVRARHLETYLEFAEQARGQLTGPQQGAWLDRLDLERENLLSAHQWCDTCKGGGELGLRLASSIKFYLLSRGMLGLAHRVMREALARTRERNRTRCRTLFDAGQIGCFMGNYAAARATLEESLAIAREIGDDQRIQAALQPLGSACLGLGDLPAARAHLEEALAMAERIGKPREIGAAMSALASFHCTAGALDAAEPLYEKALAIMRSVDDRQGIALSQLNLAIVSIGRRAGHRARAMLLEALSIAGSIGVKTAGKSVLEICAGLGALHQDWKRAARYYGTAEEQGARTGIRRSAADEAFLAPWIAKARASLGEEAFGTAEAEGRALPYAEALKEARDWLETPVG